MAKYNGKLRLKKLVKGASISYEGNGELLSGRMANGVPMSEAIFDYLRTSQFRWAVSLDVVAKYQDFTRVEPIAFTTDQDVKLNSLSALVDDMRLRAMLDMPESYKFHLMTWKARVA